MRAEAAIKRSDIVLLVVEADEYGVTAQDKKIAKIVESSGKGCIIVANKWDLCGTMTEKAANEELAYSLKFLKYAPVVFVSALTGYNLGQIINLTAEVRECLNLQISTSLLNRIISDAYTRTPPPVIGRRPLKIYYSTMVDNTPPTFVLFVNDPGLCSRNYISYLNNVLQKSLEFTGWPIILDLRKRPKPAHDDRQEKMPCKKVKTSQKVVSGKKRQENSDRRKKK
jgi:GTP-binding protein